MSAASASTYGNLTAEADPLGHVTKYAYDSNGNRLRETRTRSKADGTQETLVTAFTYDKNGRVLSTTQPDGSVTSTTYDWRRSSECAAFRSRRA